MPDNTVLLRPRDPLIARDARPFAADPGARATTLPWPLPSTVAGALRTHIGSARGFTWGPGDAARARLIGVHGPLLAARQADETGWTPYIHQPRDAVLTGDPQQLAAHRLLPGTLRPGEGCDLPHPALHPLETTTDDKPLTHAAFWSIDDVQAWLTAPRGGEPPTAWLPALPRQTETHVSIDPKTGLNQTGALFATTGLVFGRLHSAPAAQPQEYALLCQIADPDGWSAAPSVLPLGGERRLAQLEPGDAAWPSPSNLLRTALRASMRLRLLLVTPALFEGGWRPGWLDADLRGAPPGAPELRLRLVSAAIGRRTPVSGWDYQTRAPKPTRFAAPAGSVYFFEIDGDRPLADDEIDRLWLTPLSDDAQDRRDGFGLALPGTW